MSTATLGIADRLLQRSGLRRGVKSPVVLKAVGRRDLPRLAREYGFTRGAEIGVWKGEFSAKFCEANPALHMLCVDPWLSYPAWLDTKNAMPVAEARAFMTEAHQIAQARLTPLRCTIARTFSVDAAAEVPDGSLDFVYIDGNHVFDAVTADLEAWSPKVRSGGFIAGHDYRIFTHKPTIHVVKAVNAYTETHAIDPWFVLASEPTPSFLWEVR